MNPLEMTGCHVDLHLVRLVCSWETKDGERGRDTFLKKKKKKKIKEHKWVWWLIKKTN